MLRKELQTSGFQMGPKGRGITVRNFYAFKGKHRQVICYSNWAVGVVGFPVFYREQRGFTYLSIYLSWLMRFKVTCCVCWRKGASGSIVWVTLCRHFVSFYWEQLGITICNNFLLTFCINIAHVPNYTYLHRIWNCITHFHTLCTIQYIKNHLIVPDNAPF